MEKNSTEDNSCALSYIFQYMDMELSNDEKSFLVNLCNALYNKSSDSTSTTTTSYQGSIASLAAVTNIAEKQVYQILPKLFNTTCEFTLTPTKAGLSIAAVDRSGTSISTIEPGMMTRRYHIFKSYSIDEDTNECLVTVDPYICKLISAPERGC